MHSLGSQLVIQSGEPFKTWWKYFSEGIRYHGTLDDGGQAKFRGNGRKQRRTPKVFTYESISSKCTFKEFCRMKTALNFRSQILIVSFPKSKIRDKAEVWVVYSESWPLGTGMRDWTSKIHHWVGKHWGDSVLRLSQKSYKRHFRTVPLEGQKKSYHSVFASHFQELSPPSQCKLFDLWGCAWEMPRDCHRHPKLWHQLSFRAWLKEVRC